MAGPHKAIAEPFADPDFSGSFLPETVSTPSRYVSGYVSVAAAALTVRYAGTRHPTFASNGRYLSLVMIGIDRATSA